MTTSIRLAQVEFMNEDYQVLRSYLKTHQKIMILAGETALSKTKTKLFAALEGYEVKTLIYGKECTEANNQYLASLELVKTADILIGIGGGKALDTAKSVAQKLHKPILTIPTIASTCAASSAIAVVYTSAHVFESLNGLDQAPSVVFIPLDVIAQAPVKYMWAGIGDTLAKPLEIEFSVRGKTLTLQESLAQQISWLCIDQSIHYGAQAIQDNKLGRVSEALTQTAFTIIVTTGYASCLIAPELSGSLAHALNNALTHFEEIELHHLHGEVVALGVLVLCKVDHQEDMFKRLYPLYKAIGLPTKLSDLNIPLERSSLKDLLKNTVEGSEMAIGAYPVSEDVLYQTLQSLESLH